MSKKKEKKKEQQQTTKENMNNHHQLNRQYVNHVSYHFLVQYLSMKPRAFKKSYKIKDFSNADICYYKLLNWLFLPHI